MLADREGRLEDRPLRIKGEIFPYRDGINIDGSLNWLADNGFIIRYTTDEGRFIAVVNFSKHQNPHKNEPESGIPAPTHRKSHRRSVPSTSGNIQSAPEKIGTAPADSLLLIPDSGFPIASDEPTPHPVEKPKQPAKARKPDPLFDAVAEVTNSDPVVSGAHVGKVRALLAKADPPYTPAEVREFGRRFEELCPYAKGEGRRPSLGEIEKNIGKVRSPPPSQCTPTKMPHADDIVRIMTEWRPPQNAPAA